MQPSERTPLPHEVGKQGRKSVQRKRDAGREPKGQFAHEVVATRADHVDDGGGIIGGSGERVDLEVQGDRGGRARAAQGGVRDALRGRIGGGRCPGERDVDIRPKRRRGQDDVVPSPANEDEIAGRTGMQMLRDSVENINRYIADGGHMRYYRRRR